LTRGIDGFVVGADFLPLLDTLTAEAVLTLAALFGVKDDHLANAADEVLVQRFSRGGLALHGVIVVHWLGRRLGVSDPAEGHRIDLHVHAIGHRLAALHNLLDFVIKQAEKAFVIDLTVGEERALSL
jgi:hypothetical protein